MADTAIFDVDGTLVDTNYQHALAWLRAFRRFGINRPMWRIHRVERQEDLDSDVLRRITALNLAAARRLNQV
jgi:beta-phosphoglucomutase-like phosphatase (HAD superfamily)